MFFTRNWKEASKTRAVSTKSVYFETEQEIPYPSCKENRSVRNFFASFSPQKQVKQRISRSVFGYIFDGDYHAIRLFRNVQFEE